MKASFDPVPRLPHGTPFLLLDRVLEIGERTGAFSKLVSAADPCVGRDGRLPAAFVIEALAQGGGALLAAQRAPAAGYLAAVDDFRMLGEVRVGDELRVEVEILRNFGGAILLRGRVLVDGELCAEGRITLKPPR
ncbi:MAG: 3-hydroxyacyl-[acyl-carrier-protein] dehydratase FabZ [Deltaproteobacteria bacterium]|nr:MAG: 3-hydroxyacyl-[acyl-carrier-protein] dehydratase FabZ [Deltaproteobacteria bacterium]